MKNEVAVEENVYDLREAMHGFLKSMVGESIATFIEEVDPEEVIGTFEQAFTKTISEESGVVQIDESVKKIAKYLREGLGLSDNEVAGICGNLLQEGSESDELNNEYNAEDDSSHEPRQPLSDVQAFSTLYDKGLIDKSNVSKYVASQKQDLRSTLSNLMGREWASRAWSSMAPKTQINAWIDADKLLSWNKSIILGKVEDLPSSIELATALLFNTSNLESTIADGIYEDMCVNAIVCYHFAALVASVAKQDKDIMDKLKDLYETDCDYFGFIENFGCNSIFALCHTALGILRAILLRDNGLPLDSNCKASAEETEASWDNSYGRNAGRYFCLDIGSSFKESYIMELCRVLTKLEKRHGYQLSQEDADAFKIPHSILLGDEFPSYKQPNVCSEAVLSQFEDKLVAGCEALETIVGYCETVSSETDSLGSTQVESVITADNTVKPVLSHQIITFATVNEQTFNNALARGDMQEAVRCLAMNIVIEQELFPKIESNGVCANIRAMNDIRYKNARYISVVETGSQESVSRYVEEHRGELLDEVLNRA